MQILFGFVGLQREGLGACKEGLEFGGCFATDVAYLNCHKTVEMDIHQVNTVFLKFPIHQISPS